VGAAVWLWPRPFLDRTQLGGSLGSFLAGAAGVTGAATVGDTVVVGATVGATFGATLGATLPLGATVGETGAVTWALAAPAATRPLNEASAMADANIN